MGISKPFLEARTIGKDEKYMLYLMALILPPVPLFVMTGPNYTIRTLEFGISALLTLAAIVALLGFHSLGLYALFVLIAFVYSFRFVQSGFDRGRNLSTGFVEETPRTATPEETV